MEETWLGLCFCIADAMLYAINYSMEESQAEKKGWSKRVEFNSYVN